jgi:hypothetical protein
MSLMSQRVTNCPCRTISYGCRENSLCEDGPSFAR